MTHLTGYDAVVQVVCNVHRGHQQTAVEHAGLNEHAELAADMPRVNGLDGRLIAGGQLHEVHHLCVVQQLPPVEVAPVVGGEVGFEQRVGLVDVGTSGVRRTHLKPRRVPEHGQVVLNDIAAQRHLAGGGEEDGAARAQYVEGGAVEGGGDVGSGGRDASG